MTSDSSRLARFRFQGLYQLTRVGGYLDWQFAAVWSVQTFRLIL